METNLSPIRAERKKYEKRRSGSLSPIIIVLFIVLILYTVSLFIPMLWALGASLKDQSEFRLNPLGIPNGWFWTWEWNNYVKAFELFYMPLNTLNGVKYVFIDQMFLNALLYSVGCAFTATLVSCVTAYLCAKFKYALSKVMYTIVIVVMVLPIVGNTPAALQLNRMLNIYDTIWGMWIMKANFLGMYFLVFHATFESLPNDFAEAAYVDGASEMRVLTQIMLPLVKGAFFTILLLNFIALWNDYQTPMLYIPSHPTIAYGMFYFSNSTTNETNSVPLRMTGCFLMMLPILVLFSVFHKRLIGNVSLGGLKE